MGAEYGSKNADGQAAVYSSLHETKALLEKMQVMSDMDSDAKVNQDIYKMLLQRLETAKITLGLEKFKEGSNFNIVEPARVPLTPSFPDKIMFLVAGIVLGIVAGVGCIFLAEKMDSSFKDVNDAKASLDLPILGVISTIITEDEFCMKRNKEKIGYAFLGVVFVAAVLFVVICAGMNI